jgi:drug/metabolite transporter (DMT)-like permease
MIYLVLLVMTMIGSTAALFLKKASCFVSILSLIRDPNLYIGAVLYIAAALLNIYILHFLDYAVVLPLTSVTYVWTLLLSHFILRERLTAKGVFCIAGIILGSCIVSLHL